jgi:hypothetical protein
MLDTVHCLNKYSTQTYLTFQEILLFPSSDDILLTNVQATTEVFLSYNDGKSVFCWIRPEAI